VGLAPARQTCAHTGAHPPVGAFTAIATAVTAAAAASAAIETGTNRQPRINPHPSLQSSHPSPKPAPSEALDALTRATRNKTLWQQALGKFERIGAAEASGVLADLDALDNSANGSSGPRVIRVCSD
jgi:hypothetical protein